MKGRQLKEGRKFVQGNEVKDALLSRGNPVNNSRCTPSSSPVDDSPSHLLSPSIRTAPCIGRVAGGGRSSAREQTLERREVEELECEMNRRNINLSLLDYFPIIVIIKDT